MADQQPFCGARDGRHRRDLTSLPS
ncbi:MAG: hypothetical protein AVDCRST_MAG93-3117, partial [uncultured Chloroflexia bacterium]